MLKMSNFIMINILLSETAP